MNQSYSMQPDLPVAAVDVETRAAFITKTYLHLFGAVVAFIAAEVALYQTGIMHAIAAPMLNNWLLVMGGFMVVGWLASRGAFMARSLPAQYAALGAFLVAEALIFCPILLIAAKTAPTVIQKAGFVTFIAFACLTGIAVLSRKDFSFLGGIIKFGFILALITIVAGMIFGFDLGLWFSMAMVALAGGSILYDTSKVLHHFPEDRYVGASLELFASVAIMFYYVLMIFLSRR